MEKKKVTKAEKDITALTSCIAHWSRLYRGKRKDDERIGVKDCALCQLYLNKHNHDCTGCPIYKDTDDVAYCENNVAYSKVGDIWDAAPARQTDMGYNKSWVYDIPEFKSAAKLHWKYLKELRTKLIDYYKC